MTWLMTYSCPQVSHVSACSTQVITLICLFHHKEEEWRKKKKKTPAYLYLCGQSDQRTVLLCKKYKWTCVAEGLPLVSYWKWFSVIEIDQLEQTCCQGNQCTSTANMTDLKWLSQFITHKASACSGLSNHTKLALRAHRAENVNPDGFRK